MVGGSLLSLGPWLLILAGTGGILCFGVLNLMDALDDHDDVTSVSSNCDIPDAILAELG